MHTYILLFRLKNIFVDGLETVPSTSFLHQSNSIFITKQARESQGGVAETEKGIGIQIH